MFNEHGKLFCNFSNFDLSIKIINPNARVGASVVSRLLAAVLKCRFSIFNFSVKVIYDQL